MTPGSEDGNALGDGPADAGRDVIQVPPNCKDKDPRDTPECVLNDYAVFVASRGSDDSGNVEPSVSTMLGYALDAFLTSVNDVSSAVADFTDSFGNNKKALEKHLTTLPKQRAATWQDGLEATIIALKTNEAILTHRRIPLEKELFEIA